MYSTVIDDVDDDGEMGISHDHSELIAHSDTSEHVANSAPDATNSCVSLFLLQPHSEAKRVLASLFGDFLTDVDGDVFEGTSEGAKISLDSHVPGLDIDGHIIRDD